MASPGNVVFKLETALISIPFGSMCMGVAVANLVFLALTWPFGLQEAAYGVVLFGATAVAVTAMLALWYLSTVFLRKGRQGLAMTRPLPWICGLAGSVVIVCCMFFEIIPSSDMEPGLSRSFLFGAPLLVPLGHLAWVRHSAKKAVRRGGI